MLISIIALYFVHGRQSGVYTFDYLQLLGTTFSARTGLLLMLGFFVAFAVKLPALPLHGWLPDAHSQANTAGSVLLAGLLIKVGAYGLLRFLVPLFPRASFDIRGVAMGLAVAGILYGALMAFAQTDLKRMVAYTSVSHMGFVLLGVFAWNELALQGVVLQIVCHAFSTGGLFIVAGVLEERLGTRDLGGMGGLWARLSTLGGFGLFLAMAALGLPGLGNFVAEFLILLGTFSVSLPAAIVASLGLVVATVYALWLVQRVFHGPEPAGLDASGGRLTVPAAARPGGPGTDRRWRLSPREIAMFAVAIIVLLWLGLYPQALIRTMKPAGDFLLQTAPAPATAGALPGTASATAPDEPAAASEAATIGGGP
jgi:NADH-quinone oxidoreductase subunit M